MHHDYHAGREQFWPHGQISARLARDVHLPAEPEDAPHDPAGHDLACPGHHTSVQGELEVVALATAADGESGGSVSWRGDGGGRLLLVEGEVGVDVLVAPVVEDEDGAEKSEHADGFGEGADEDVAGAEFLVRLEGLAVDREQREEGVEGGGHGEGPEDDEEGG